MMDRWFCLSLLLILLLEHGLSCSLQEFECTDGICIERNKKCDNTFDCADLSDEMNCGSSEQCPEGLVLCDDGTCLLNGALCHSLASSFLTTRVYTTSSLNIITSLSSSVIPSSRNLQSYSFSYQSSHILKSLNEFHSALTESESKNFLDNILDKSSSSYINYDEQTILLTSQLTMIPSSNLVMLTPSSATPAYSPDFYTKMNITNDLGSYNSETVTENSQSTFYQSSWIVTSTFSIGITDLVTSESILPTNVSSTTEFIQTTVVSTTGKGSTPNENNDLTPLIVAISVVAFLFLCGVIGWQMKKYIRKRSRKTQFGSMLSLDMVHPHPDENVGAKNGIKKKGMVKSSSYNALKDD